jgi:hypothetical protein
MLPFVRGEVLYLFEIFLHDFTNKYWTEGFKLTRGINEKKHRS